MLVGGANTVGPSFGTPSAAFSVSGDNNNNATNDNRLSVDSTLNNLTTALRPSSVLSNASSASSSLRLISTTSADSRLSRASSCASSLEWDEQGLEIRERMGKEQAAGVCTAAKTKMRRTGLHHERVNVQWKVGNGARYSRRELYPSSEDGGQGSGKGRGGGRMGAYPIVTVVEATMDELGCVDDEEEEEEDRMLVDEEERGHRGIRDEDKNEEDRMDVDDEAPTLTMAPEQLLKGSRPKAVYGDDEGYGMVFMLREHELSSFSAVLKQTHDIGP